MMNNKLYPLNFPHQLTQDQVPALVYSSNRLPAVGVSRRERLLSAAYNGLVVAMGKPHFVGIVHLLPHMRVREDGSMKH